MATAAPINLTSLAALKAAIDEPSSSTALDAYLTRVIAAVSAAILNWLGREAQTATYTETFDIEPGQRVWTLKAYPIDSVTSVKIDHNREFGAATAIDSSDYVVLSGRARGAVKLLYDEAPGDQVVQITYQGGMGSTTQQLVSGFPEVEAAAQLWASAIVKKRKAGPQGQTVTAAGGSITKEDLVMPKAVKELLGPLRRMGWGSP